MRLDCKELLSWPESGMLRGDQKFVEGSGEPEPVKLPRAARTSPDIVARPPSQSVSLTSLTILPGLVSCVGPRLQTLL